MRNLFLITSGVLLLAIGCRTKDPLTRAEIHEQSLSRIPLTNAWVSGGAVSGAIQGNWLASFGDEQLMALVREAITNNPDLAVAAIRVEKASAQVDLAKAALKPAINILGTGGFKAGGGSDVSSALQFISLGASWEVDLWGRLRYGRNAAQSSYESIQADVEYGRQSLAAAVARSWFFATETLIQQQIAEQMVGSATQLLGVAESRFRVGAGTEQDVALARANVRSFEDAAKQAKLAHEQTIRALELLLGRYPATELASRNALPALPGPVPTGIPLEMLDRRPDMIAAERRIAAAFHLVGEAKAARLPRLKLNASIGLVESDIIELKEDFENPTAGAGGWLMAPIYQGGALKTQVKIRSLEQKAALVEYAGMALRAIGDVENALATSQSLAGRLDILHDLVAQNERALELTDKSYRIGKSDLSDVQQRQIDLQSARLILLRVESDSLVQRINLHLALGGGFEEIAVATNKE